MSDAQDSTDDSASEPELAAHELPAHEMEAEVELLSQLLVHEFSAVERAATKVRESSAMAKKLVELDLLNIMSRLRLARAMDDFTSIYLDLKDEEAEAARELLEELGDDDDEFEDFDEFDDEDFDDDDEDDFGNLEGLEGLEDLDDEDDDDEDEEEA